MEGLVGIRRISLPTVTPPMSPSRTVVTKGISDISCESKCRLPVELEIPPKLPDYLMEAFPLQFGGYGRKQTKAEKVECETQRAPKEKNK